MINKDLEITENDPNIEKAEKKNTQATCWVGTWNNPKMTDEEFHQVFIKFEQDEQLQYMCFQRECGEEETPHFQFFIVWKNAKRFKWCKEQLPYGTHFKPMITNMVACKNYSPKKILALVKLIMRLASLSQKAHALTLRNVASC